MQKKLETAAKNTHTHCSKGQGKTPNEKSKLRRCKHMQKNRNVKRKDNRKTRAESYRVE